MADLIYIFAVLGIALIIITILYIIMERIQGTAMKEIFRRIIDFIKGYE